MERVTPAPREGHGVVVSIPKMEGVVSGPLPRIKGMVSVPVTPELRYEARPATSSPAIKVGSLFGYRRDPFTRRARFHSGVDIKAKTGDPVGSSQAGIVQFAAWYHGYGNLVIVDHGGGVTTYYAHLSSFRLGVGDRVERGTVVGYAGSTGRATSPHLHYELRIDGNAINPFQQVALDPSSAYFKSRSATSGSAPASPVKTQASVD
jgi:murein DD-endopeptidase MepM/ murein hydrolase activator NlpD